MMPVFFSIAVSFQHLSCFCFSLYFLCEIHSCFCAVGALVLRVWALRCALAMNVDGKVSITSLLPTLCGKQEGLAVEVQRDHVPDGAVRNQALRVNAEGP